MYYAVLYNYFGCHFLQTRDKIYHALADKRQMPPAIAWLLCYVYEPFLVTDKKNSNECDRDPHGHRGNAANAEIRLLWVICNNPYPGNHQHTRLNNRHRDDI